MPTTGGNGFDCANDRGAAASAISTAIVEMRHAMVSHSIAPARILDATLQSVVFNY